MYFFQIMLQHINTMKDTPILELKIEHLSH